MATIRDVARRAGVSIATVSRVFNDSPRVVEATRKKVLAAAARLDYWPNSAARSLTTSRHHLLGVLLPDLHGEFFSEVIRGMDHGSREQGFQILISSSHADSDALLAAVRAMRGRIDGLIAMAADRHSLEGIERMTRRFPVVLLNPSRRIEGCGSVSIANAAGAGAVVRHLAGLGHRSIAMLKGPRDNVDARERFRGYRRALRQEGITPSADLEFQGDFTEASGVRVAGEIARSPRAPSAVFTANDSMAVGLLSALREAGVRVPEDVALVGFDDTMIAGYLSPALTTVRVDAYGLGRTAVELLLSALAGTEGTSPGHRVLPANLVVRDSCGGKEVVEAGARAAVGSRRRAVTALAGETKP